MGWYTELKNWTATGNGAFPEFMLQLQLRREEVQAFQRATILNEWWSPVRLRVITDNSCSMELNSK